MFWNQTLAELFQKGSFAMWPLLLCSVIGVTIILERGLYFARLRLNYDEFIHTLKSMLQRRQLREATAYCLKQPHPVSKIAGLYLKNLHNDRLRAEILKREGSYALEKVERNLKGLASITHIAPLLGLLGTVTGLVTAFHQIQLLGGQVQPSDLAQGIWEALITTVFGLVIAIPCMVTYHGYESAADRIARRLQFVISELDEFFGRDATLRHPPEEMALTEELTSEVR